MINKLIHSLKQAGDSTSNLNIVDRTHPAEHTMIEFIKAVLKGNQAEKHLREILQKDPKKILEILECVINDYELRPILIEAIELDIISIDLITSLAMNGEDIAGQYLNILYCENSANSRILRAAQIYLLAEYAQPDYQDWGNSINSWEDSESYLHRVGYYFYEESPEDSMRAEAEIERGGQESQNIQASEASRNNFFGTILGYIADSMAFCYRIFVHTEDASNVQNEVQAEEGHLSSYHISYSFLNYLCFSAHGRVQIHPEIFQAEVSVNGLDNLV